MNKAMKRKSIILASVACAVLTGSAVGVLGMNSNTAIQASAETTTLTEQSFVMPGASVRIATDKNGIRFPVWLPVSVYEANKETIVESGTLLCPKELYDSNQLTVEAFENETSKTDGAVTTEKWAKTTDPKTGTEYYQSMIYLYNIPTTDMETEIMARGYVKTATETLYSPIITRSMAEVAYQAMQDPEYASHATTLQGYLGNYIVELQEQAAFEVYDSVDNITKSSDGTVTAYTLSENNLTIDLSSYDSTITEAQVAMVVDGERTVLDDNYVSVSEKVVSIDGAAFGSSVYGNVDLQIITDNKAFETSVNVVTKYIDSVADLENMFWYGGADTTVAGTPYDGYFVMTEDVDCNNVALTYRNGVNNNIASGAGYTYTGEYGFAGIFDGQGHKIYNLALNTYTHGVFGNTQIGSEIKNVAFCGTTTMTANNGGYLLGRGISSKITNCYIDVAISASTTATEVQLLAINTSYAQMKDVVIKYDTSALTDPSVAAYLGTSPGNRNSVYLNADAVTFDNVYVFMTACDFTNTTRKQKAWIMQWDSTYTDRTDVNGKILTNVIANDYSTAVSDVSMTDDTYWKLTGTQPIFKSVSASLKRNITYTGNTYQTTAFETYSNVTNVVKDSNGRVTSYALSTNTFTVDLNGYGIPSTATSIKLIGESATKEVAPSCFADGVLTVTDIDSTFYGKVDVEFVTEDGVYTVSSFNIVTKYINNKADLENMFWYGGADTTVAGIPYDGYFVMTADVDCGNAALTYRSGTNTNITSGVGYTYNGTYGFAGIFDGQGHKIYNLALNTYTHGVFGNTQIGSEIKNVAFCGTTTMTANNGGYLLGSGISSKITNCYIDVAISASTTATEVQLLAINTSYAQMKDVVIKYDTSALTDPSVAAYLGTSPGNRNGVYVSADAVTFDNVYVFMKSHTFNTTTRKYKAWIIQWDTVYTNYDWANGNILLNVVENDYDAKVTGVTMTDSTYWNLVGDQPVWKGCM